MGRGAPEAKCGVMTGQLRLERQAVDERLELRRRELLLGVAESFGRMGVHFDPFGRLGFYAVLRE